MIKNLYKIGAIILIIVGLNSCAYHSGLMTGNASLSNAEFSVIDFAIGSAETIKVFGFGGLKSDALVLEAKRNLYENYPLDRGQALANVTVDFKREYYLFWSKLKVIVSADIIDFNEVDQQNLKSPSKVLGMEKNSEKEFFNIGDEILFLLSDDYEKGAITDINKKTLTIRYFDAKDRLRTVKQLKTQAYHRTSQPDLMNFDINETVKTPISVVNDRGASSYEYKDVLIIGLGKENALIEYVDINKNKKRMIKAYGELKKK
ncbi:MAG: DUF6567 family protein [Bacteroidota bacterium]